ncbi:hypothetical protein V6N12_042273 [Hibiscus sabdariffa]|uniref:Uncharacterized protein n=1 Tax=Hibiscus sabdariffa TaxID=183260 RepID=A0ABR2EEA3_9ROSI
MWSCGWPQAFGSIVWSLWLNRNSLVLDPDFIGVDSVLGHSRWLVESYNLPTTTPLGEVDNMVVVKMLSDRNIVSGGNSLGLFHSPSVIHEVLHKDMRHNEMVAARLFAGDTTGAANIWSWVRTCDLFATCLLLARLLSSVVVVDHAILVWGAVAEESWALIRCED